VKALLDPGNNYLLDSLKVPTVDHAETSAVLVPLRAWALQ
jgi:hypothetical protein